jgi:hypothetical protein
MVLRNITYIIYHCKITTPLNKKAVIPVKRWEKTDESLNGLTSSKLKSLKIPKG